MKIDYSIMKKRIIDILKQDLSAQYKFGFADLTGLLPEKFSLFVRGISILRKLDSDILNKNKNGPTRAYFHHYEEINEELRLVINKISSKLKDLGINCIGRKPTSDDSEINAKYSKTLRTEISHKMVATRAGLGWIGKTDLFISRELGPRLRLASILLEEPIKIDSKPVEKSECKSCIVCVDHCPAKAGNGKEWDIYTDRDTFFNAFKCRDICRRLAKKNLDLNMSLCGRCVAICPRGLKNEH